MSNELKLIFDSVDNASSSVESSDGVAAEEVIKNSNQGEDWEKTDESEGEDGPSLSNTEISSLIDKMLMLGYFHNKSCTVEQQEGKGEGEDLFDELDVTVESMKEYQASYMDRQKFQRDRECTLLFPSLSSFPLQTANATTSTARAKTSGDNYENEACNKDDNVKEDSSEKGQRKNEIFCITRDHLKKELFSVTQNEGRVSLLAICDQMKLPMDDVNQAAKDIIQEQKNEELKQRQQGLKQKIYLVQKELITDLFLSNIFESKVLSKLYEKGSISVSDLAMTFFHLPLEFMLQIVENRIVAATDDCGKDEGNWNFKLNLKLIMGNDNVKKIITEEYENKRIEEMKNILADVNEPIKLIDLFHSIDCDPHQIFIELKRLCSSKQLQGEIHTDNSSSNITAGTIYVPHAYEQHQRNTVETLFQTHGYITKIQANQIGVSSKRLEQFISDIQNIDNDAIIILANCIIHQNIILTPLQAIIEECIEMESFVDLSFHLPSDILCYKDDVRTIMMDYIVHRKVEVENSTDSDPAERGHYLLLEDEEALYFSRGIINNISVKILQPLIEEYAKSRAKEIVDGIQESKKNKSLRHHSVVSSTSASASVKDGNKSRKNNTMSKNKIKNSKKKAAEDENDNDAIAAPKAGLPPLKMVVQAIGKIYTDLMDIQDSYNNSEKNGKSGWCTDQGTGGALKSGPLYVFCRCVLNKDSGLEKNCARAVDAEIKKIMKMRQGSSTSMSRKQGAMKCQNIEKLFEEHFQTACYYIQLKAKFPQFLLVSSDVEVSDDEMDVIVKDFLHHCAWFAKRITEYCLFKAGLDVEGVFQFTKDVKNQKDDQKQEESFYSPVDVTERFAAPSVFLSCTTDSDDPLQLLREIMPGNIGVGLARMWIYTGGQHYDGGIKFIENDGSGRCPFVRPGDMNKFLSHVEENCLTMVGIPFKLLDKKWEKKLMFSRRKELTAQLQAAANIGKIYDISIMLLYQQMRNMIIRVDSCNDSKSISYKSREEKCIIKVALKHLFNSSSEKKRIPLQVKENFDQVSSLLLQNSSDELEDIPENLTLMIKGFGLSKDITSHVVPTKQEEG